MGSNAQGQLGNGTTTPSTVPVSLGAAPAGTRFAQVAAGNLYSLALAADGTLYAWGFSYYGQLGDGTTTSSSVPVAVGQGPAPAGTRFGQMSAGSRHAPTLATDGTLYT